MNRRDKKRHIDRKPHLCYAEAGFSVVEIMISLVLGLVVVAGVTQVYLGSKQSYRLTEAQSRMQEDGRFALDYLARNIRQAGYRGIPQIDQSTAFPSAVSFPSASQIVTGTTGNGTSLSDSISLRFEGISGGIVTDCLSVDVNNGVRAVNTFYVDMANHELECTAVNPDPEETPSTQPIISGFGNFLVLYGIDTDDDGRLMRAAHRYVNAGGVGGNWLKVTSVRVRFQLRSAEDGVTPTSSTYTFNGASFTDRRLVQTFETTIALRNALP